MSNEEEITDGYYQIRPAARLIHTIGSDLIGDSYAALVELVKNSYDADAKKVSVVGEFNKWNAKSNPLKKLKNGNFKGTIDLETGKKYQFRYLVDGVHKNEEKADAYVYNDFAGTDNSVIEL